MKFAADLRKYAEKYKLRMEDVARAVPVELASRVILASPVDTGRFRGNWNVATNRVDATTTDDTDKGGDKAIGRAQAVKVQLGDDVYVTNNLPYAQALENGHSQQAPAGMVGVTLRSFTETVNRAVSQAKSKRP